MWLYYLALEPIVRRFWPDGLIGWNRLLAGRWRDPLVGWHLLCGLACGIVLALTLFAGRMLFDMLENGSITPWIPPIYFIETARAYLGTIVQRVFSGLNTGLFVVLCYAFARGSRAAMGRNLLALLVAGLILSGVIAQEFIHGQNLALEIAFVVVIVAVIVIAMRQFGLLALMVMFFVNQVLHMAPFTLTSTDWYAPISLATIALLAGLAIAGFVISRGGEPLLGRVLADE
jgi:hypothetical protein